MKFKSFIKFLTGTVVIGVATVTLINALQKKYGVSNEHHVKNTKVNTVNQLKSEKKYIENQTEDYNVKETVGIAIAARHEVASEVIKEALSNINNGEKQSNDSTFEELTTDLEKLSK